MKIRIIAFSLLALSTWSFFSAPSAIAGTIKDRVVFKANARMRASGQDAVAMRFMDALYRKNPSIPAGEAISITQTFLSSLNSDSATTGADWKGRYAKQYDLAIKTILLNDKVKTALNKWVPFSEVVAELLNAAANRKLNADYAQYGGAEGLQKWSRAVSEEAARKNFDKTLDNVFEQSRKNPEYRDAFFALFSSKLQSSPLDSAEVTLGANPILALAFEQSTSLGALEKIIKNDHEAIGKTKEAVAILREEMQALANSRKAEQLEKLDLVQANHRRMVFETSLDVVTRLLSLGSPEARKAATSIRAIGSAALQLDTAIRTFSEVSELSGKMLGTALFAGNVLNIGVSFFQAFSDTPTPDQMILDAIGDLRTQITDVQTQMHERFDHVDRRLADMHLAMEAGFSALSEYMRDNNQRTTELLNDAIFGIEQIKLQTSFLSENLYRLEASFTESLSDLASRDFKLLDSSCSNYLTLSAFQHCRKTLEVYAVEFSKKPLGTSVNGATDFTSDGAIRTFLNTHKDSLSRINYLHGVNRDRFFVPPSTHVSEGFANPLAWLTASRSLLSSLTRNASLTQSPQLGRSVLETLRNLQQQGLSISQAVRDLARRDSEGKFAFMKGVHTTLLDARSSMLAAAQKMDTSVSRTFNGMNLRALVAIGENDDDQLKRMSGKENVFIDPAKLKVTLGGNAQRLIGVQEGGFAPLSDWVGPESLAGTATNLSALSLDVTGEWKGQPFNTYINPRECTFTHTNGLHVTLADCTFTKRVLDTLKVTRSSKVFVPGKNEPILSRTLKTESREPIVYRECTVRCRANNDLTQCRFEVEDKGCSQTDPSIAALSIPMNSAKEEKTENKDALANLRHNLSVRTAEALQVLRASSLGEDKAPQGRDKFNLAMQVVDAWLRATYETSYLENDTLLANLVGADAPTLNLELATDWGMTAYLHPDQDPFLKVWNLIDQAVSRFQLAVDARQIAPSLAPVNATLEEIGTYIQTLKIRLPGSDSRSVIERFMKKANQVTEN